ncbi:MAG: aminoglycoside phosphotransferase family protein [Firmicutes bacterium]|nr:aminoglycoside phosphotransferase family protein [Bacillota bacterium]
MNTISAPEGDSVISQILAAYVLPGTVADVARHGKGHINDTFCVVCKTPEGGTARFILQRLSQAAFPHPEEVMENFVGITSYLRREILAEGGDPLRETLSLVKTGDGADFVTDAEGRAWRLMPFIENAECYQSATPELFAASGRAFGRFQYMLRDYPARTLHETIPHFHDTESRFEQFLAALEADKMNRAEGVSPEIQFILRRKADCGVALRALREGKLPLRVTHNDTKLNNILIDRDTHEGICIIDLDTTMPGLAINDFGDSIRFGANHCMEDEQDLTKVNFDISLYEVFTRGFLEGARGSLTSAELEYLPWGARLMTLECGIRFLTDYLDGDHYFHVSHPRQNLDRARTQLKLVKDMEEQFDAMGAVVAKYAR